MAYGVKTTSPVEEGLLSTHRFYFNEIINDELGRNELDFHNK